MGFGRLMGFYVLNVLSMFDTLLAGFDLKTIQIITKGRTKYIYHT